MASHAVHRSMPPRTPSHRPRAVSLSEYQPLAFDRDAIQAAYQSQLTLPSVSSSAAGHGMGIGTGTGTGSGSGSSGQVTGMNSSSTVPTRSTGVTDSSGKGSGSGSGSGSGGHHGQAPLKIPPRTPLSPNIPADEADLQAPVPIWASDETTAHRAASGNYAGIGAGHSLTPPGSPMHRAARARASSVSLSQDGSVHAQSQSQAQGQAHALSPIPASPAVHSPVTGVGFVYPSHPPPPIRQPSASAVAAASASGSPSTNGYLGAGAEPSGLNGRFGRLGIDDALDVPDSSNRVYGYNPTSSEGQLVSPSYAAARGPGTTSQAPPLPQRARPPIAGSSNGTGLFNSRSTGRTGPSGQAEDDGWDSDPGFPRYVGGERGGRRLPAVPDNVPAPPPPAWEPDYKPQIPPSLTQPSIDNAYAQLSAPPPGVTPRTRPNAQACNTNSSAGPSQASLAPPPPQQTPIPPTSPGFTPQEGAPEFPPTSPTIPMPMSPIQISSQRPERPRLPRPAEDRIHLRADGRTPIWSTHYLDPSLRNTVVSVPAQLSNLGNMALSGLAGGEKTGWNSTTGAPIDGMARLAKEWFLPPDGRFTGDKGPIELSVGVVNAGETGWGREKGRKRARVEVANKAGGIKVELIEVDDDRQIDMKVESKTGDILVLLPADFFGTIHVSSPNAPHFCRLLGYNKARTANPNEVFWSTFIVPPDISILANAHGSMTDSKPSVAELTPRERKIRAARPPEHKAALGTAKYMPDFLKGQDPMVDQVISAYAAHTRGEWSKVHVTNMGGKGRVVFGYRESEDEEEIREMGLRVGVQHEKRRRWWNR